MKIIVLGYFGRGNLGDNLMRDALQQYLSTARPDWSVDYRALPPFNWKGVQALLGVLQSARKADAVVFSGGTYFPSGGGLSSARLLLFWWSMLRLFAAVGAPVYFAAIGLPHVTRPWSVALVRRILEAARLVLLRDEESGAVCRSLGINPDRYTVGTDLAFLGKFDVDRASQALESRSSDLAIIGASFVPAGHCTGRKKSQRERSFVDAFTLANQSQRLRLKLFVYCQRWHGCDVQSAVRIGHALAEEGILAEVVFCQDVGAALQEIAKCDIVVAMRYHAVLMSTLSCTPVIVLPYDDKVRFLARQLALPKQCLILADRFRAHDLGCRVVQSIAQPQMFQANSDLAFLRDHCLASMNTLLEAIEQDHERTQTRS